MNTPIYDFVKDYASKNPVRLHMPGHKGNCVNEGTTAGSWTDQVSKYDITEIDGADYLSAPCGIIAESEANAGKLFGCNTFYSTEGSSLCIRAMLFLIKKRANIKGNQRPMILAGRNAHASFVNAAALLDISVDWIMQKETDSYESCTITGDDIEKVINGYLNSEYLIKKLPDAVYITSPDYLGNVTDIREIAEVCHKHGIPLLVDCAHGAYLKFLDSSLYPTDLGADMCCSSAHKTLPVLTGGAYLNINKNADPFFTENAKQALSVFATTSPSYLILQSLDICNKYIYEKTEKGNNVFQKEAEKVGRLKEAFIKAGYTLTGNEALKITLTVSDGDRLAKDLTKDNIFAEYHDKDHLVMMFGPETTDDDYIKIQNALEKYASGQTEVKKEATGLRKSGTGRIETPRRVMSMHDALFAKTEQVEAKDSVGRTLAEPVISCPPCVPLYVYGEKIGEEILGYISEEKNVKVVCNKK